MKMVNVERSRSNEHITTGEWTKDYVNGEGMTFLENLDPGVAEFHVHELDAIENLEEGSYLIMEGNFDYLITITTAESL